MVFHRALSLDRVSASCLHPHFVLSRSPVRARSRGSKCRVGAEDAPGLLSCSSAHSPQPSRGETCTRLGSRDGWEGNETVSLHRHFGIFIILPSRTARQPSHGSTTYDLQRLLDSGQLLPFGSIGRESWALPNTIGPLAGAESPGDMLWLVIVVDVAVDGCIPWAGGQGKLPWRVQGTTYVYLSWTLTNLVLCGSRIWRGSSTLGPRSWPMLRSLNPPPQSFPGVEWARGGVSRVTHRVL
ncbi:hypothetical protein N658DRAFT_96255 [Parathielavia hyrcaniae]|uniref:Uncharacterized protein n=1 Tax=Parathielavia hyrcaniae TaxID=113614 RepID=A0AAN6PYU0_9PEZI|nr:hypothetical protein N658DRAFT_96255 [Parathielavia hyrcaniae]